MDASPRIAKKAQFDSQRLASIGIRLERDVASGVIPGAAIMIGSSERTIFEQHVGFRELMTSDPLRSDAIWRIYSMTKPIVTTAAMVFVENGLLRLDQAVAEFIPSFAKLHVAQSGGPDVLASQPPTIQDLMLHTAGLSYGYLGDSTAQRAYVADGFLNEDLSNEAFVERLAALPLEHHPGATWHYSHATDVLGRVLEIISGRSLGDVLHQTLFQPLGMLETCFELPPDKHARVAEPLPQPGCSRPHFFDPCLRRRHQSAGGGLLSTVDDYARFLRMLLGNGTYNRNRILSAATVSYMTADHLGNVRRGNYYPPGPGYGFGLGVAVRLSTGVAPFPGSRGDYFWSGVGGTYFWVDPARQFFALFMLQSSLAEQRLHYRTLMRNMIYAAIDD